MRALVRLSCASSGCETDPDSNVLAPREEIAGAIALHHSEGAVEKADRDRLLGALDLGQRQVEEVMLHRRDIEMIDADAPPAEILDAGDQLAAHPASRSSRTSRRTSSA